MTPLSGIRVLTVEQFGAAPYGTMLLAQLGAEVVKIENPVVGGDPSRHVGPHLLGPHDSQYFQTFNLDKKSVALDLKTDEGREGLLSLVESADAIVNNLRGDQPEKLGLDYHHLKERNPAIVCLHISAYGRDNERKDWPGYDYLMQAEAGLMAMTGEPDGPPTRLGLSMIDFMTGTTGMVGLLAALLAAQRTGKGCDVDISLFDTALHQLSYPATWLLNEGEEPRRLPRNSHPSLTPVQTQRTADGWIFVMCMMDKFWEALVAAIGEPGLAADARFRTNADRARNREALTAALDAVFETGTTASWLERLAGRLPVAPVYGVREALESGFVERSGMIAEAPHPLRPEFRVLASPLKIDGARARPSTAHGLGADTASLLAATPSRQGRSV